MFPRVKQAISQKRQNQKCVVKRHKTAINRLIIAHSGISKRCGKSFLSDKPDVEVSGESFVNLFIICRQRIMMVTNLVTTKRSVFLIHNLEPATTHTLFITFGLFYYLNTIIDWVKMKVQHKFLEKVFELLKIGLKIG